MKRLGEVEEHKMVIDGDKTPDGFLVSISVQTGDLKWASYNVSNKKDKVLVRIVPPRDINDSINRRMVVDRGWLPNEGIDQIYITYGDVVKMFAHFTVEGWKVV